MLKILANKKFRKILIYFSILNFLNINLVTYSQSKIDSESVNEKQDLKNERLVNPDNPTLLKGHISKIPGGTKLGIILETPIDEFSTMVDDEIRARISENIVINGGVVIPVASLVTGIVSEITPAKRLHKAGTVRVEFKGLILPDGREVPIVASVLTHSGLLKGKLTKKNALISGATLLAPVAAGLGAGLVVDGSAVGATIGAVVGAVAGISLYAFQRGNKIDIRAGDELNIELTEEAIIPGEGETLSADSDEKGFCLLKNK